MIRLSLGRSELSVSPVAFGTWQLSPRFWGEQSREDALSAMQTAFDSGINFFDTADAYGDGYAETVLGEALAGLPRQEVVVCTKWFNHFNPDASRYPDLSPGYLTSRCEASLKRLGIDSIDLVLLHFFDQLTPLADVAATLEVLKDQGKIRHYGVSNHTVEQVRAQRCFGAYDVVQPPYSLLEPVGEDDLLAYCQAENIGVMVYSPMHKGLLTGKYAGGETFSDFRKNHPDFQHPRFREVCEAVQSLRPMADGYGLSLYQLILAATLMHPALHTAICGIKTPGQVAEAAAAMDKTVSREDYFTIRKTLACGRGAKVLDARGVRK